MYKDAVHFDLTMLHGFVVLFTCTCLYNRPAFIHALWIADPSKRATGRNMQPSRRRRKKDLNAVCDRQQARVDPLLFTKRPAN